MKGGKCCTEAIATYTYHVEKIFTTTNFVESIPNEKKTEGGEEESKLRGEYIFFSPSIARATTLFSPFTTNPHHIQNRSICSAYIIVCSSSRDGTSPRHNTSYFPLTRNHFIYPKMSCQPQQIRNKT